MASTHPALEQMTPVMHRVVRRHQEQADTVTLWLDPSEATAPPIVERARAGQFNMLWSFGIGEAPISLAGVDNGQLVHTIRDVGPVTAALCACAEGDEIGVRGPYGKGWGLSEADGHDIMVVAGGLGVAPVRPIVEQVLGARERFGQVAIFIGARAPEHILYAKELEEWGQRPDIDLAITVDTASPAWRGEVGLVTRLIESATYDAARTSAYVCGPEVMMRFAAQALTERGVPPEQVEVSLERNMHCAIGHCGHCQLGPSFICKDGPVLSWTTAAPLLRAREL